MTCLRGSLGVPSSGWEQGGSFSSWSQRAGCCYKPANKKDSDGQIPNNPHLPPQLICQLHNVTMHLDMETVYAQMTLQPLTTQEQEDMYLSVEIGIPSRQPNNYFCKNH